MKFVLPVISVARRPLSANAIADLLYPNEEGEEREGKRAWVENIVRSLFSILYVEEKTNAVRACHLSVLDFIGEMVEPSYSSLEPESSPSLIHRGQQEKQRGPR